MTSLWIAVTVAAGLATLWLVRPLLKSAGIEPDEADSAISIYRDQQDELRRDVEAGLISEAEHDAAQMEIETRALAAAKRMTAGLSVSRRSPVLAGIVAVATLAAAVGTYVTFGKPGSPDLPLTARKLEALNQRAEAGDLNSRIQLLIEKTKDEPESFETWWLLARSYSATGDHTSAADAYRRAADLKGDDPAILSAYAESLTLSNGNKVPQAARIIFEQVLSKRPDPRARYYMALSKAQAQDFEAALADWTQLAKESQPDAPWMRLVRRDIVNMARFLKRDVTEYLPDATSAEIANASGKADTSHDNAARIATLEEKLGREPKDYKGWIELTRLYAAAGRHVEASDALSKARSHFSAAPFVMGKLDETARSLGLDLFSKTDTVKGPSEQDIAAASSMSAEDQASMIEGMVEGLAAKLEENPSNPDGWLMLIRSYVVLGKTDKAQAAYQQAVAQFTGQTAVLNRLKTEAGSVLSTQ